MKVALLQTLSQLNLSKFSKRKRKSLSGFHILHKNVKLGISRCSRAVMAKKCTKKYDARAELLFCQSKPIVFLPFSLMSLSLLLKLLNLKVESVVAVTCLYSCMHNVK